MSQSSATSTESEGISLAGDSVQRVVVIGAGECAARFVTTLRELGYEGSIVLLGDEGLAPYERPPLSKQTLLESPTPNPVVALSEERLRALNVSFDLSDCAVSVDRSLRQVVTRNSATYTYDRLLFATGAKSRPLPFDGAKHALMLRTHREALLLREALQPGTKVAVIGGGFIGLEVAASARSLGCDVTVIEVADRLMGRAVPIEIAALMEQRHHDEGVQFILGVGVESIELTTNDHPYDVHLSNGSTLQADLVLAGIGAIPETTIAAECELAVDNGIAADQHLRTSDPFIYAAGDCVSFPHPLYGDRRKTLTITRWWPLPTCSVAARRRQVCRGFGRTSTISLCRLPGWPLAPPRCFEPGPMGWFCTSLSILMDAYYLLLRWPKGQPWHETFA
jgi:3-phenylpropionate/trans-cinnamate dioxygenase ferredoxin reductase component